jgi:hypothetical protein
METAMREVIRLAETAKISLSEQKQVAAPTPVNETLYRVLRITEQYLG